MNSSFPPMVAETEGSAGILFFRALHMQSEERGPFLDQECGGNATLRSEVEDMLRDHERAGSFLGGDSPASSMPRAELTRHTPEQTREWIGPYKLLEQLGEGGFGTVWVAEQERPVRRRVALKIIKPGMDTKQVIARFEQERQALAMMDHPNIAKVFDAGATPLGRPYFVMELVRGVKITKFCDQANLPTAERLTLFIAVCHAVQHAHQKGIIHRDLKPSNILLTLHDGVPVPKVIDFGVAKATQHQPLTDLSIYTQFEQMIGTPAYMSPEQAEMSGLDIDTRSDIYALGVLLYELLTGHTPFDAKELLASGLDAMRRTIRETDPPKPSTRLTQSQTALALAGQSNQSDIRNLKSEPGGARQPAKGSPKGTGGSREQIDSDLDWIVMKALEKDRSRRYETATGFAQDIQRHLLSEPVQARPPTQIYRFQRMVRRNKFAFAATAAVLAALLIGLGVSTCMFLREKDARERAVAAEAAQNEERRKAETEAGKSRQVARFLKDMLNGAGPSVALGDDTKMLRKVLDKTAERIGTDLKDQPEAEVDLREVIGTVYGTLGDYGKAVAMFEAALVLCRRINGPEHAKVSELLNNLALELSSQGKLDEAEAMLRESLAMKRRLSIDQRDAATGIDNLALVLADRGRFVEAEKLHREALALKREADVEDNEDVATSLNNLGVILQKQQKFDDSEQALRQALAIQRGPNASDTPGVAATLNNLANVLQLQNRIGESETLFREVLALQRKFLGNAHPNVATALNGLGLALLKQGKNDEAEPLLREGAEIEKKARGAAHPQTATLVGNLGRIMEAQGKFDEAEARYREALTILGQQPGPEHPAMASWRNQLVNLFSSREQWPELEAIMREDLASARGAASRGGPHSAVSEALIYLASALREQSKFTEAEALLLECNGLTEENPKVQRKLQRDSQTHIVRLYEAWSKPDKAAEWQQKLAAFEKEEAKTGGEPKAESSKQ